MDGIAKTRHRDLEVVLGMNARASDTANLLPLLKWTSLAEVAFWYGTTLFAIRRVSVSHSFAKYASRISSFFISLTL